MTNTEKGFIYFVQGKPGTPIKIGFTWGDLQQRLKGLQTSSPEELRPLVLVPGDITRERALHKYFSKYRIQGEWFEPSQEILSVIEKLKSDGEQELERLIGILKVNTLNCRFAHLVDCRLNSLYPVSRAV